MKQLYLTLVALFCSIATALFSGMIFYGMIIGNGKALIYDDSVFIRTMEFILCLVIIALSLERIIFISRYFLKYRRLFNE